MLTLLSREKEQELDAWRHESTMENSGRMNFLRPDHQ